jgi:hypothetical protein
MGFTFARPRSVVAVSAVMFGVLAGGAVFAGTAGATESPLTIQTTLPAPTVTTSAPTPTPQYSLTLVARSCPSFTDIQANRARNNLQETYSDLGIDANPPYSDNMSANPVSPARESSTNATGYSHCTAIPGWTFSFGTGLAAYGAAGVGNSDHISVVTTNGAVGASDTAVTQAGTPALNDAGQFVNAAGQVVADSADAAQISGATTVTLTSAQLALAMNNALWVQGGKAQTYAAGATDTNKFQLNADQSTFTKSDGSPLYAFGSLRCVTDALNGDNVESVALSATRVHGYCYAYYVSTAPQPGTITVLKHVTDASGDGKSFAFQGNVSFTPGAIDDANTDPFSVTAGATGTTFARSASAAAGGTVWTVQEPAGANAGWSLDSLVCTSAGGSTFTYSEPSAGVDTRANITLAAGDDVTCTATNWKIPPIVTGGGAGTSTDEPTPSDTPSPSETPTPTASGTTDGNSNSNSDSAATAAPSDPPTAAAASDTYVLGTAALANTGPGVSIEQGIGLGLAALGVGLLLLIISRGKRDND